MILVSCHRHESCFRENKGFEIFREISIFFLWSIRDMQPRLISVHWVENDLDKQKNIEPKNIRVLVLSRRDKNFSYRSKTSKLPNSLNWPCFRTSNIFTNCIVVKNSLDFGYCILFITCPFSSIWWLVSLSLSKLTTCFIHWAPLAGESGCAWILNKNIQRLAILALVTRRYIGFCCKFIHCISQELK